MSLERLLAGDSCDALSLYRHPLVHAVLGGSLHPGGVELSQELWRRGGLGPGSRVLDVGCGEGASSLILAREHGCHVTAVDRDGDAVAEVRRRAEAEGLLDRVDARPMGPDGIGALPRDFDAVFSECALCLMGEKADVLDSMARRLRPGGRLLLSDVTLEGAGFQGGPAFAARLGGAGPHDELVAAVKAAAFQVVWQENRPELVRRVRDRVRAAVDVEGVVALLGGPEGEVGRLVAQAEAALDAGRIGYACMVAEKVAADPNLQRGGKGSGAP